MTFSQRLRASSRSRHGVKHRSRIGILTLIGLSIFGGVSAMLLLSLRPSPTIGTGPLGLPAPIFALADQDGRTHNLADYLGRPMILAFYPAATPEIVEELRSLKATIADFDRAGAKIFAISTELSPSHKTLHDGEHLPFPLLTDGAGKIAALYGALDKTHRVRNEAFVVDAAGMVVAAIPEQEVRTRDYGQQILGAAKCCFVPMVASANGKIGMSVANFVLPRIDTGQPEPLYGDRRQKATVVFFISSKCPCSQGYDARIRALADQYTPRAVRFAGIYANADETVAEDEAHREGAGFLFSALRDEGNVVADRMEARVTPEAFLIDSQGKLRYHGRIDDDRTGLQVKSHDLQAAIEAVLKGKHPAVAETPGLGCAIFRKQNQTVTDGVRN